MKIYKCVICKKIMNDKKPIRIVKQLYGAGEYNQYGSVEHYDFCDRCYSKIDNWIQKHREEK